MMSGEGIAAVLGGIGLLAVQLSGIAMQWKSSKVSRANSEKLDAQGIAFADQSTKIAANTALTEATAKKVEDIHAATATLVEATGTHKILPPP